MPEDDPIPPARVVDQPEHTAGDHARRVLHGFLGAVMTMGYVLGASFALGSVIARLDQHAGPGLYDAGAVLVFGLIGFVLVKRIVKPKMLAIRHRGGRNEYLSSSWVHALFDLGFLGLGVLFLSLAEYKPGPEFDLAFGWGLGFTIVPGALFMLRLVFVRRLRGVG